MSIETVLTAKLKADAPLLGNRVHPLKLPQDSLFPAARYVRVGTVREYTHGGPDCLPAVRFQIDVFDETFAGVRAAFEEVRKSLSGFQGVDILISTLDTEQDDYEDETALYRVMADFVILHEET